MSTQIVHIISSPKFSSSELSLACLVLFYSTLLSNVLLSFGLHCFLNLNWINNSWTYFAFRISIWSSSFRQTELSFPIFCPLRKVPYYERSVRTISFWSYLYCNLQWNLLTLASFSRIVFFLFLPMETIDSVSSNEGIINFEFWFSSFPHI
jgi:hypothetical protein